MPLTIGIDFGGVLSIHDRVSDSKALSDTSDEGDHTNTLINMPKALESLKELKRLGYKLVLISFCGRKRAVETKASIDQVIPGLFDEIFFTVNRDFKGDVCRKTGCDVMIDDRHDVLMSVRKTVPNIKLFWFGGDRDHGSMQAVKNWDSLTAWIKKLRREKIEPDPSVDLTRKVHVL